MAERKNRYEQLTENDSALDVSDEAEERHEYVPGVIYTQDSTPDLSKLDIPLLRLAQGMTDEVTKRKATPGQWVLANFPAVDEVLFVPLAAQTIRKYKPNPRQAPVCHAPTGDKGIGDPGILCADCKLKDWGPRDPKTGKGTPPACKSGISIRGYSLTHESIVDIQFMGQAEKRGIFLQTQAMVKGFAKFAVKLESSTSTNDKGTWADITIEMIPGGIPEEQKEATQRAFHLVTTEMPKTRGEALAIDSGQ